MEVAGLCSVCGKGAIIHTCKFCGAQVCDTHYDVFWGICNPCRSGRFKGLGTTSTSRL